MSLRIIAALILLATPTLGQKAVDGRGARKLHYPNLIHAEVPLYPSVPWTAHISGTVDIQVTVDKGAVVNAEVKSVDVQISDPEHRAVYGGQAKSRAGLLLSNPAVANVKTWKFKPEASTTFFVRYIYRIRGEETRFPESPDVELNLPRSVTVTARPFKPSCSDCSD